MQDTKRRRNYTAQRYHLPNIRNVCFHTKRMFSYASYDVVRVFSGDEICQTFNSHFCCDETATEALRGPRLAGKSQLSRVYNRLLYHSPE